LQRSYNAGGISNELEVLLEMLLKILCPTLWPSETVSETTVLKLTHMSYPNAVCTRRMACD
jgi:hypothetical protein